MLTGINSVTLGVGHQGYVVTSTYSGPQSSNIILPARQAGDIMLLMQFRNNSALPAAVPDDFTTLFTRYNVDDKSITVSYQKIVSNAVQNTISTFNSTSASVLLLRRCTGIGNFAGDNAVTGSSAVRTLPQLTLSKPRALIVGTIYIHSNQNYTVGVPTKMVGYSNNTFLVQRDVSKQFPATTFTTSPSSFRLEATVEVY